MREIIFYFFIRLPKRRRRRPNRWMTSGKNVVKQGRLKSELSSIPSLMDVFVSDGSFNSIFSRPISIFHAPIIFENAIAGHVPLEAIDQSAVEIIKIIFVFL